MLRSGADMNAQDGDKRWTAMHLACGYGHEAVAVELSKRYADTSLMDTNVSLTCVSHDTSEVPSSA
jgi:ankyrin repeat protein